MDTKNNLDKVLYSIYDLQGKRYVASATTLHNNSELLINTSGLSVGMYFLVVEGAHETLLRIPFVKK